MALRPPEWRFTVETNARYKRFPFQRWLVAALTLSLLLIPATCASAAGPHSIFVDPAAHAAHLQHESHHDVSPDIATMTEAELLLHLAFGHQTSTPVAIDDLDDPCDSAPKLRDLPSSMAMAALSMPSLIADLTPLDLPAAAAPKPASLPAQIGVSSIPESPPPKG